MEIDRRTLTLGGLGVLATDIDVAYPNSAAAETSIPPSRLEEDALGEVEVPAAHLWGAQTQRSRVNFPIGVERFRWGRPVIRGFGILKKCAALANGELGQLSKDKVELVVKAAQEVIDGKWDEEFPWSSSKPAPAPKAT